MRRLRTAAALTAAATMLLGSCTSDDDGDDDATSETTEDASAGGTTPRGHDRRRRDRGDGDTLAAVRDAGVRPLRHPRRPPRLRHPRRLGRARRVRRRLLPGDRRRRARRRRGGRVRRRRDRRTGSPPCSPARSTCSCATPRGRPARDGTEGGDVPPADVLRRPGDDGRAPTAASPTSTTWPARSCASPAARPPRATSPPSSPGSGLAAPESCRSTDVDLLQQAFQEGRCDGWSSDRSQLTGLRSAFPDGPDALVILDDDVLQGAARARRARRRHGVGPGRRVGDLRHDPGRGVRHRLRPTSTEQLTSDEPDDPDVPRRRASTARRSIPGSGCRADFAVQVVTQVGNYGEIFEANITPLGLERGQNELWTDGGLLYAPPYR